MAIIAKIILKMMFSSVLVLKFSRSTYSRIAHIVAQNVAVKDSINLLIVKFINCQLFFAILRQTLFLLHLLE